jgi:hypothetical protein
VAHAAPHQDPEQADGPSPRLSATAVLIMTKVTRSQASTAYRERMRR